MTNYEISLIYNPNFNASTLKKFLDEFFPEKDYNLEKLEKLTAAYKIKGHTKVHYYVVDVNTDSQTIQDFQRKAVFNKAILRFLVIKTSTESGLMEKLTSVGMIKVLQRYLRKKFSEKDIEQPIETEETDIEIEDKVSTFKKVDPITKLKQEVRFPKVLISQFQKHYQEYGQKFSVEKFFMNMGFEKSEIPKEMIKWVSELEEKEKQLIAEEIKEKNNAA